MADYYDTPGLAYDTPGLFYDDATPGNVTHHTMKKAKVVFPRSDAETVASVTESIVAAMTGNANFATPAPTLASVSTKAAAVRAKKLAITGLESDLSTARTDLKTLIVDLKTDVYMLRDYVQDQADGDESKIHSAGMQIVGERQPVGPMPAVQNLKVMISDMSGTLDAEWQTVAGSLVYLIETALNPEGTWTQATACSRSRCTITGLVPGTKYWVRVRAVGAAGLGPYSDVAYKIAA